MTTAPPSRNPPERARRESCDAGLASTYPRYLPPYDRCMAASKRTLVLAPDGAGIERAAAILRDGGLVAFPTETVYGLGANALDAAAVAGIFRAKGRPAEDPLIVHLASADQIGVVARDVPERAARLARRFWPGPLTLILPKTPAIPDAVTAGLDTVGVRVPSHPVAHRLLVAAAIPIAAPSANLFARPSPTRAEHVLEDLGGRVDAVLDGGATDVGVESTIVDVTGARPRLLRPGGTPAEAVEAALGGRLLPPPPRGRHEQGLPSPGLLDVHYAPRTPLTLIVGTPRAAKARLATEIRRALADAHGVGLLQLDDDADLTDPGVVAAPIGRWGDDAALAARLFDALRALDRSGLDLLFCREVADPAAGLGRALADRLRRAAATVIEAEAT